jgi:hypothetical protein
MNSTVRAIFFAPWVIRKRRWLIAASTLFIVAAGLFSLGLNLDPSLESRFLKNNPQVEVYKELQRTFGTEPLIAVVFQGGGDIFSARNLERLHEFTEQLRRVGGIQSVLSLSELAGDAGINPRGNLLRRLPLVKKLLAGRNDTAVIALVPAANVIAPAEGIHVVNAVRATVDSFVLPGERAFVTGALAMQSRAIELSQRDLARAISIVAAFATILFGSIYRSWRAVAAALMVSCASILGACALLSIARVHLSQFSLIAIPILAAIALQDAVHLLEHFLAARRESRNLIEACEDAYASCAAPCFWTTATTVIGFAALFISDIEQIRSIGLVVVIGAPIALAATLVIVPALVAGDRTVRADAPWAFDKLAQTIERQAPAIVFAMIALSLIAAAGLPRARATFDFPRIFRPGTDVQKELAEMDAHLSGGASFEIILETTDGSDFTRQDKLMLMANLQTALSLTAAVTTTISPIDAGITAYALNHGASQDASEIASRAGMLVRDMRRTETSQLEDWITGDLTKARIHARVRTDKVEHYDNLMTALASLRDTFAHRGVRVSWSGLSLLYKEMERRMVTELIASFGLAFAGILLFMIVIFRSWRWGLASMAPNILPVAVIVGIMGWAGVGFSLGLIILPAVGLGLVVDDTIHLLWGVRRYRREGCAKRDAITRVLHTTGRALVLSTAVLIAGFVSLIFSPFISNNQLAIFMPLLLVLALVFDLVGVPAILMLAKRTVRAHQPLGEEAVRAISPGSPGVS